MTLGADIAAEVAEALAEAGTETGDGPLICTIKRPASGDDEPRAPWEVKFVSEGDPTYHEVTAIQQTLRIRDQSGTLTGETRRMLTVDATGTTPLKDDLIAVGVTEAEVTDSTVFEQILDVETIAPGGVALMHEVELRD